MRWVVLLASLATAGCGLDKEGLGPWSLGDGRGATADGGGAIVDSGASGWTGDGPPMPALDAALGPCVASIPRGWNLVAYEPARMACPAAYAASYDALTNPQAGAGACTCTCSATNPPSCDTGSLSISFGQGTSCPMTALPLGVGNGGCTQLQPGGPSPRSLSAQALGLTGGSCKGYAVGDTTKVTTADVRYCVVPGASAEGVCNGAAPTGFSACIVAPGQVACPSGPFSNQTILADAETLVCSACTSCAMQGTCVGTTVKFYGDYLCNAYVGSLTANGMCSSPGWANGQNVASIVYEGQVSATCSSDGTSPGFEATGTQTICCR